MRNLRLLVRSFGLLALLTLIGCGSGSTVGILLPETGAAAPYGDSMRKAIDLGLEQAQANKTMPVGLTTHFADSGSDPEKAIAALNSLADQGADIVIAGVTSDEAKALLPVLEQRRILCLSPSASAPRLTKDSRNFYRLFTSDELEGSRAGRFLFEDRGHTSTIIYTSNSEHARGIEPPFRHMFETARGGKVVGKVYYTDADWQSQSTDLLVAHNPGSVYIIGYADETLRVLEHLREKGFEGTICAASSFNSGQVIEQNPELFEDVYFPQPAFDTTDERPVAQEFIASYRSRYDQDPDIYAAHAFDAVTVVLKVIAESPRLEFQDLRKTMQFGVKELPGVTGIIQFDDFGDVHHNPVMFVIKDGKVLNHQKYVEEQKALIQKRIRDLLRG